MNLDIRKLQQKKEIINGYQESNLFSLLNQAAVYQLRFILKCILLEIYLHQRF